MIQIHLVLFSAENLKYFDYLPLPFSFTLEAYYLPFQATNCFNFSERKGCYTASNPISVRIPEPTSWNRTIIDYATSSILELCIRVYIRLLSKWSVQHMNCSVQWLTSGQQLSDNSTFQSVQTHSSILRMSCCTYTFDEIPILIK